MMRLRPWCCGKPRRRPWRSFAEPKSGTATAVMSGVTAMEMEAPGVAAAMVVAVVTVGMATSTTAVEEAAVTEAEEARLVEGVSREAARIFDEVPGAVTAALGEAAGDDETARVVVPRITVHLSARPRLQVRTAARPRG